MWDMLLIDIFWIMGWTKNAHSKEMYYNHTHLLSYKLKNIVSSYRSTYEEGLRKLRWTSYSVKQNCFVVSLQYNKHA